MTVAVTSTRELTIDQVVKLAWRCAGLLSVDANPTEGQYGIGRELLETMTDELVTQGLFARSVDFYNLTLVAGTHIYSLPNTTVDVIGNGAYLEPGESLTQASGETTVQPIDRAMYQSISAKSSSGSPTMYYLHRVSAPPSVYFWPIPSEAGTVRFQVQKLLADCDTGASTLDVERFWVRGLVWALAAEIAASQSLPAPTVMRLEGKAEGLLRRARSYASEHINLSFQMGHRTPWSS